MDGEGGHALVLAAPCPAYVTLPCPTLQGHECDLHLLDPCWVMSVTCACWALTCRVMSVTCARWALPCRVMSVTCACWTPVGS